MSQIEEKGRDLLLRDMGSGANLRLRERGKRERRSPERGAGEPHSSESDGKGGRARRRQRGRGAALAGEGGIGEPLSPHTEGTGMNICLIRMKRGATPATNKGKSGATLA